MKLQVIHIGHCPGRQLLTLKQFMGASASGPFPFSPVKNKLYHRESVLCLLFILLPVDASDVAGFAKQHIRILLRLIGEKIYGSYLTVCHIVLCDILQLIPQLCFSLIQSFCRRCQKILFLYLLLSLIQEYIENISRNIRICFKILRYKIICLHPSSFCREIQMMTDNPSIQNLLKSPAYMFSFENKHRFQI